VVAEPDAALALVETALAELDALCCGLTVPRGVELARWIGPAEPGEWDLMRCDEAPAAHPAEHRVSVLEDPAAVQAFLDRVNPHHSVPARHPEVERWMGVADAAGGGLLAVGAFTRRRTATPYLASIATDEQARGQGLGGAVTAALTRHAFASGDALCTLAHYHPNDPARRLYQRLGYRTTHQNRSGELPGRERGEDRPTS
jgi:GNAT superfamily N-acetyltransferase